MCSSESTYSNTDPRCFSAAHRKVTLQVIYYRGTSAGQILGRVCDRDLNIKSIGEYLG